MLESNESSNEKRPNADVDGTLQRIAKLNGLIFFEIVLRQYFKNAKFGRIKEVFPLRDSFQRKKKLELDTLFIVVDENNVKHYFNIEFQSINDRGFIIRLHEYYSSFMQLMYNELGADILIEDYPNFNQIGLYVGDKPLSMVSDFTHMNNRFEIGLLDIRTLEVTNFLESGDPNMIVLAILVYEKVNEAEAFTVIKKLQDLNLDHNTLMSHIKDVFELSIKRFARGTIIKIIDNMHYETLELLLADPFYQEGIEKGIEQGKKEGLEKGLFQTALNMWEEKLPLDVIQRVARLSDTQWKEFLKMIGQ